MKSKKEFEDIIAGLLFVIDWLGDYVEEPDEHYSHVEYLFNIKWKEEFLKINKKYPGHSGDCTNECHTCLACQMEKYNKIADKLMNQNILKMDDIDA